MINYCKGKSKSRVIKGALNLMLNIGWQMKRRNIID